ncbi:MAG: polysaccharide biosynthesis tyrosine autokinase [Gemmatimonadales bacterium]
MRDRRSGSRSRDYSALEPMPNSPAPWLTDAALQGDGITPAYLVRSVRENLHLFLAVAGVTLLVTALLVTHTAPQYSARSVIRLAGERRTLTRGVENAPQTSDRAVDPLLSVVQVLSSRTLVGAVVDSLGLRLQPATPFTLGSPLIGPRFPAGALQQVTVTGDAPPDTLMLRFGMDGVIARSSGGEAAAPFGERLRLGAVGLTVPKAPPLGFAIVVVQPRDVAIDQALERLKVVPRPGTDVIDVRYVDSDPARAEQFVNHLARLFLTANGHAAQGQSGRRREFLSEQLRVTDSMLVKAEAELSAFRGSQQMGNARDNLSAEQATAATQGARRGELVADRRVLTALLQRANQPGGGTEAAFQALAFSPEVASDSTLGRLQHRLVDYRARLDSLTTGPWRSMPTDPDVVQLSTLLRTTQSQLVGAVRARIAALDARIAVLSNQQALGALSIQSLPAQQAAEATLDRRVEVLRTTTDALRQEYQKARISEALGTADIEILDVAPLPYREAGIPRAAKVGLGLLLGILFGGAAAVLANLTNRTVRTPRELQDLIGTTELGTIPRIQGLYPNGAGQRLLAGEVHHRNGSNGNSSSFSPEVLFSPSGAVSSEVEAFRMLRISLAFSWGDGPCTLVVTSAAPQEGKTLIATNLAVTFARGGARVLLVDCDIHRPRLHRVFRVSRTPGLMDLLRSSAPDTTLNHRVTAIRKTGIDRLSFLPCGTDPQDNPELLEPAMLRGMLKQLQAEFDVILLDTPPVLVSADAATLAASADGVIMVVRAGQTDRGAADVARQRVVSAGGRVLGVVLNDPDGVLARFGTTDYAYDYPALVD